MISHEAHDGTLLPHDGKTRYIEVPMSERNPELRGFKMRPRALCQPEHQANDPTGRGDSSVAHPLCLPLLGMRTSFEVSDLHGSVGRILEAVSAKSFETFDGNVGGEGKEYEKRDEITRGREDLRMYAF